MITACPHGNKVAFQGIGGKYSQGLIIPVAVPSLGVTENVTGRAIIPAWITTHTLAAVSSVVENVEF